jgi:hypothetical protein
MGKKALAARRQEFLSLMAEHGYSPGSEDGKNIRAFAERVGFDYGTARQWRCGSSTPSRHALRTIKLLLNQSPAV